MAWFIESPFADLADVNNVLTDKKLMAKKLKLVTDYKSLDDSFDAIKNFSKDHARKFEFANHANALKIYISFVYEGYLIILYESLPMKGEEGGSWETLDKYLESNKKLPEAEVKAIAKRLFDVLKFFNDKKLPHLKLHPKRIYLKHSKLLRDMELKVSHKVICNYVDF